MQRENERGRIVFDGKRTDDDTRCSLVVIDEVGDTWAFYPHGARQLGVRLTKANAVALAQTVLASTR